MGLWWIAGALASTLEISVPDPRVESLVLKCSDGTYRADVKYGVATFEQLPNNCEVFMIRRSGSLSDPGKWTCSLDQCIQADILHLDVADAPGRVNIIVTTEMPKGSSFELTCPGGYRNRAEIQTNTAVFEGVPTSGECSLFFKGSIPGRFNGMKPGTWSCGILGSTAVCKETAP